MNPNYAMLLLLVSPDHRSRDQVPPPDYAAAYKPRKTFHPLSPRIPPAFPPNHLAHTHTPDTLAPRLPSPPPHLRPSPRAGWQEDQHLPRKRS
ncbi:hypothetical protein NliqN6_5273 [Naganishia liquefaciens]|uniref:Uncharacterized protein n=1 Tax=Naganishia liquefaciens TaxID=104408 RepID=A0A8H3YIS8_9TREE|nr:hypothetical protein NliqN6_5273 [Naganishia liquefaciens]